jgi:multidrug resistance protein, MATE family
MGASTHVLIVIFPINLVLNVYFVHYSSFGINGSPIALSLTFWLAFLFLIMYTACSPTHTLNQTWGGFQLRAALDPRSCIAFLKLALPGILMVGSEWCVCISLQEGHPSYLAHVIDSSFRASFEIVALAAARLGNVPLAAQSVIMTTDQSSFLIFSSTF